MANFTIYCDELSDELLARQYLKSGDLQEAHIVRLPTLARAPEHLKPLLRWERLDWIVCRDDVVTATVEFSRHGYTGDNGFQRFARLFRSATLGFPTVYFTPFNRTRLNELDDGRQSPRNVAPELFEVLLRMTASYRLPCLAVHWPTAEDGTAAPLTSPAAEPSFVRLCGLVRLLAVTPAEESLAAVEAQFTDVLDAMQVQAAIGYRGGDTRGRLSLPAAITGSDWVWQWLPRAYFGSGKADKVLASVALGADVERPVIGDGARFWEEEGDAWVLWLGYQWRPDPASGLIALAAETARSTGVPLIVVWPRVFRTDSGPRRAAIDSLRQFKATGDGPVREEARRLQLSDAAVAAFRERVSTNPNQFGIFQANSKPGRILADVADAVILGDAVLTGLRRS